MQQPIMRFVLCAVCVGIATAQTLQAPSSASDSPLDQPPSAALSRADSGWDTRDFQRKMEDIEGRLKSRSTTAAATTAAATTAASITAAAKTAAATAAAATTAAAAKGATGGGTQLMAAAEEGGQFPGTTDLLIRSYSKDTDWFDYSVRSFLKYGGLFHSLQVVCPEQDVQMFQDILDKNNVGNRARVHGKKEILQKGYDEQQMDKLNADLYSDAEYICMIDSDSILTHPARVSDFFQDGKPLHIWRTRKQCGSDCEVVWAEPIQRMFKELERENDYMTRLGQVYPRNAFNLVRHELMKANHQSLEAYALTEDKLTNNNTHTGNFLSEFNALGVVLFRTAHDSVNWCQLESEGCGLQYPPVMQGWSWDKEEGSAKKKEVFNCVIELGDEHPDCKKLLESSHGAVRYRY